MERFITAKNFSKLYSKASIKFEDTQGRKYFQTEQQIENNENEWVFKYPIWRRLAGEERPEAIQANDTIERKGDGKKMVVNQLSINNSRSRDHIEGKISSRVVGVICFF